jgi:hypothetical protein
MAFITRVTPTRSSSRAISRSALWTDYSSRVSFVPIERLWTLVGMIMLQMILSDYVVEK